MEKEEVHLLANVSMAHAKNLVFYLFLNLILNVVNQFLKKIELKSNVKIFLFLASQRN